MSLLLAAAFPPSLPAQIRGAERKVASRAPYAADAARLPPAAPALTRLALATIQESEPNDTFTVANSVALGDTVTGVVNPAGDRDVFAFDVPADTRLDLDVDASEFGSPLDPWLELYASDGTTLLAYNDDADGLDSRLRYTITTAGRYFVLVRGFAFTGGPGHWYTLKLGTQHPGPGDPTALFATGLVNPRGVAATAAGELLVAQRGGIARISPAGTVSTFSTFVGDLVLLDVVVDGLGDVLVTARDSAGRGLILRVPGGGGGATVFARFMSWIATITIGPDGDVWVGGNGCGCLYRLDPIGRLRDSIPVVGTGWFADLAFSPTGELHWSNGSDAVLKLVGRSAQTVIQASRYLEGLAFDRDGYLYVANGYLGEIRLYGPTYQPIGSGLFAGSNLGGPTNLAFGRSTSGVMTSRLFASNAGYNLQPPFVGSVVEMNPTGMRATGFRVGVDLLRVANASLREGLVGADYADTLRLVSPVTGASWMLVGGTLPPGLTLSSATGVIGGVPQDSGAFPVTFRADAGGQFGFAGYMLRITRPQVTLSDAANHLLGADVLMPALERFLDLQGNRNGRYDVGDFRAFLRSQGLLPAVARGAPAAQEVRP